MTICDLRRLPNNAGPYFTVGPDRTLVLTVPPGDVTACAQCPNRHVRVMVDATADGLRELAHRFGVLADALEGRQ